VVEEYKGVVQVPEHLETVRVQKPQMINPGAPKWHELVKYIL